MKLWRTMTWGEIKLFLREPLTVVFAFGFPLVMLLVLAEVFARRPATSRRRRPHAVAGKPL
jgi:ABC-2 type transport system permease protein